MPTRDARGGGLTRRQSLVGAGTLALGVTAGCLDSTSLVGGTREPVEPEAPGEDPDATPAEFYYMLEDNGIVVEELYFDTDDQDLILFYESTAEDHDESDEEIALIYLVFRDGMVDRGADVNRLFTEVVDGFDGQVEGWGVNSEWAEMELDELAHYQEVWNQIVSTMVYPEDSDRADVGADADEDEEGLIEIGAGNESDGEAAPAENGTGSTGDDGNGNSDGATDGETESAGENTSETESE
ncbi:hypothetical protein B1756_03865 [Natrarchaeobaculum aegyptiacum]|uniref:DUF8159 domain-containing protein n=1 Tax=Natrarchaeobaculum aegyptiacum TaxID=745377 RepID=A0A2Z2I007_9EURY|nr:hypothetical protein B1756_03865 [Natrarchaeobaculum aegyptiacum]